MQQLHPCPLRGRAPASLRAAPATRVAGPPRAAPRRRTHRQAVSAPRPAAAAVAATTRSPSWRRASPQVSRCPTCCRMASRCRCRAATSPAARSIRASITPRLAGRRCTRWVTASSSVPGSAGSGRTPRSSRSPLAHSRGWSSTTATRVRTACMSDSTSPRASRSVRSGMGSSGSRRAPTWKSASIRRERWARARRCCRSSTVSWASTPPVACGGRRWRRRRRSEPPSTTPRPHARPHAREHGARQRHQPVNAREHGPLECRIDRLVVAQRGGTDDVGPKAGCDHSDPGCVKPDRGGDPGCVKPDRGGDTGFADRSRGDCRTGGE